MTEATIEEINYWEDMHNNMLFQRDQFAMAALQGILAAHPEQRHTTSGATKQAYIYADAMMEARKK